MLNFYNYDMSTEMPPEILAIENKGARSDEDKKTLEAYYTSDTKLLGSVPLELGGAYALAYRPDGAVVAVAGEDGRVRFVSAIESPKIVKEFVPVPISGGAPAPRKLRRSMLH